MTQREMEWLAFIGLTFLLGVLLQVTLGLWDRFFAAAVEWFPYWRWGG